MKKLFLNFSLNFNAAKKKLDIAFVPTFVFFSEIFTNPEYQDEWINNFEEYLPFFMEYNEVISNTSVFASAIQDFYFSGNVTLGLMHNITEVSPRMSNVDTFDNKIISPDGE